MTAFVALAVFFGAVCAGLLVLLHGAVLRARRSEGNARLAREALASVRDDRDAWRTKHDEQRALTTRAQNNAIDLAKKLHAREQSGARNKAN